MLIFIDIKFIGEKSGMMSRYGKQTIISILNILAIRQDPSGIY